jgi:hypothetical protein
MIDFLNVILLVCLIGCGIYIYWLHHQQMFQKFQMNKKIKKQKIEIPEEEPSFLKSEYDAKTDGESLFDEDNNSMLNE